MKKSLIALSLAAAFSAAGCLPSSESVEDWLPREFGLVVMPVCHDTEGNKIEFHAASADQINLIMLGAHIAVTSVKAPHVWFDRDVLPRTPPAYQYYVLFHECAHKKQDPQAILQGTLGPQEREDDADCQAAHRLREEKSFSREEINELLDYVELTFNHYTTKVSETFARQYLILNCYNNPGLKV